MRRDAPVIVLALDHVQIAIPAGGEDAARRFFGAVLGLPEIDKPEALRARGGCWFQAGDKQLHLGVDPEFRAATKAHIALAVDALDPVAAALAAAGHATRDHDVLEGRRRFFADDPFGNRIEIVEGGA